MGERRPGAACGRADFKVGFCGEQVAEPRRTRRSWSMMSTRTRLAAVIVVPFRAWMLAAGSIGA